MSQENGTTAVHALQGEPPQMEVTGLNLDTEALERCEQRYQEIIETKLKDKLDAADRSVQLSDKDFSVCINVRD
jgi:hypothetical protein